MIKEFFAAVPGCRNAVLLLSAMFFFTACKKSVGTVAPAGPLPAMNLANVSYGSAAEQKMDIYLPAGRSADSTKVIFLLHGGSWNAGDKTDFSGYVSTLQSGLPGYAIVNLNYRLATGNSNLFPAQENDVKSAADFLFSKRADYHVSSKWVLLGASAGGQLALLQSYKYNLPVVPKAVISFFGPTDLAALYAGNPLVGAGLEAVTGTTPLLNPALYRQSSPINFVSPQSPPTLLLQGGADPIVPPSQAVALRDKLSASQVPVQYVFYPSEGHGWLGENLTDSFTRIFAFLKIYAP